MNGKMNDYSLVNLHHSLWMKYPLFYSVFLGTSAEYVKQALVSDLLDLVIWEHHAMLHTFTSFVSIPVLIHKAGPALH